MKKVLVLHASHRINSVSKDLLMKFTNVFDFIEEIKIFNLAIMEVQHCAACMACSKTGECILKDSMNDLYNAIEEADIVLISSPVYFNHLPSKLKQVIDRFEPYFFRKLKLNRPVKKKDFFVLLTSGVKLKEGSQDGIWSTLDLLSKSLNGNLHGLLFLEELDLYSVEEACCLNKESILRFQKSLDLIL